MKKNLFKEIIILIILLSPIVFMIFVWNKLPERLPIHWNINGEVDNDGPKYLFPVINIALYLLLIIIPIIDPRRKNYSMFSSTYFKLRVILTLFFSLITFLVMYHLLYTKVDFEKILPIGILFLFALLGNYMSSLRSNFFVGIRTPWTLSSDIVWKKTHFIASRLMFFGCMAGGLICILLAKPYSSYFAFILILLVVLIPVVYSFVIYKNLKLNKEL